jgi:dihydrofolate reductase
MRVSLVVAAAENSVIGHGNQMPWRLPDDLKRFKALTLGKPILMGRKTFESIGKPLPGRTNIVLSRRSDLTLPGCVVVSSIPAALAAAAEAQEIAVIGGAEIYAQALSSAHVIHLTRVHANVPGDAVFPALDATQWTERLIERHPADERHAFAFSFIELERLRPAPQQSNR